MDFEELMQMIEAVLGILEDLDNAFFGISIFNTAIDFFKGPNEVAKISRELAEKIRITKQTLATLNGLWRFYKKISMERSKNLEEDVEYQNIHSNIQTSLELIEEISREILDFIEIHIKKSEAKYKIFTKKDEVNQKNEEKQPIVQDKRDYIEVDFQEFKKRVVQGFKTTASKISTPIKQLVKARSFKEFLTELDKKIDQQLQSLDSLKGTVTLALQIIQNKKSNDIFDNSLSIIKDLEQLKLHEEKTEKSILTNSSTVGKISTELSSLVESMKQFDLSTKGIKSILSSDLSKLHEKQSTQGKEISNLSNVMTEKDKSDQENSRKILMELENNNARNDRNFIDILSSFNFYMETLEQSHNQAFKATIDILKTHIEDIKKNDESSRNQIITSIRCDGQNIGGSLGNIKKNIESFKSSNKKNYEKIVLLIKGEWTKLQKIIADGFTKQTLQLTALTVSNEEIKSSLQSIDAQLPAALPEINFAYICRIYQLIYENNCVNSNSPNFYLSEKEFGKYIERNDSLRIKAINFLGNQEAKRILITGDNGAGKSFFVQYMQKQCYEAYKNRQNENSDQLLFFVIPFNSEALNSSLKTTGIGIDIINDYFTNIKFFGSEEEKTKFLDWLKARRNVCFVLDGYNELQLFDNITNVFAKFKLHEWDKSKFIFTCSNEYLNALANRNNSINEIFNISDTQGLIMNINIFTVEEVNQYLDKACPGKVDGVQDKFRLMQISELVRNPRILNTALRVLDNFTNNCNFDYLPKKKWERVFLIEVIKQYIQTTRQWSLNNNSPVSTDSKNIPSELISLARNFFYESNKFNNDSTLFDISVFLEKYGNVKYNKLFLQENYLAILYSLIFIENAGEGLKNGNESSTNGKKRKIDIQEESCPVEENRLSSIKNDTTYQRIFEFLQNHSASIFDDINKSQKIKNEEIAKTAERILWLSLINDKKVHAYFGKKDKKLSGGFEYIISEVSYNINLQKELRYIIIASGLDNVSCKDEISKATGLVLSLFDKAGISFSSNDVNDKVCATNLYWYQSIFYNTHYSHFTLSGTIKNSIGSYFNISNSNVDNVIFCDESLSNGQLAEASNGFGQQLTRIGILGNKFLGVFSNNELQIWPFNLDLKPIVGNKWSIPINSSELINVDVSANGVAIIKKTHGQNLENHQWNLNFYSLENNRLKPNNRNMSYQNKNNPTIQSAFLNSQGQCIVTGFVNSNEFIISNVEQNTCTKILFDSNSAIKATVLGHDNLVAFIVNENSQDCIRLGKLENEKKEFPLSSMQQIQFGNNNASVSATFSPDGKFLAILKDKTCYFRIIHSSSNNHFLYNHGVKINAIAFAPKTQASGDKQMIALAGEKLLDNGIGDLRLYYIQDGTLHLVDNKHDLLAGHSSPITSLAFSSDGKMLASYDANELCVLWSVENPQAPTILWVSDRSKIRNSIYYSADLSKHPLNFQSHGFFREQSNSKINMHGCSCLEKMEEDPSQGAQINFS